MQLRACLALCALALAAPSLRADPVEAGVDEPLDPLLAGPFLGAVTVRGNEAVSDEDVVAALGLKEHQVIDEEKARAAAERARALYMSRGFFGSVIAFELRPSPPRAPAVEEEKGFFDDLPASLLSLTPFAPPKKAPPKPGSVPPIDRTVDLVLRVEDGDQVRVVDLRIVGAERIPEDELRALLRTKEHVPMADLLGQGLLREDLLAADLQALDAHYQDRGFLDVVVGPPRVVRSKDGGSARVEIPVREGAPYRIAAVTLAGDLIVDGSANVEADRVTFSRGVLLDRFGLRAGDVASRAKMMRGIQVLRERFADEGYAAANVLVEPTVRREAAAIDLAVRVDAGPRVRVERIEVQGNSKTADHVIRRELRVYEGEYFSAAQLRRSEGRVRALGFFSEVAVATAPGSAPDRLHVVVRVKERNTGSVQLGAGFSLGEGLMASGQVAYSNFLGLGSAMSVGAQLSGQRQLFDLRLQEPWLFTFKDTPISAGIHAFNAQRSFGDFLRSATGTSLTFGAPVGRPLTFLTERLADDAPAWLVPYVPDLENLQLFLAASLERVDVQSPQLEVLKPVFDASRARYSSGLSATLVFDQRDNRLFPSNGYYLAAKAEVVSPMLGAALLPGSEAEVQKALLRAGLRDVAGALDGAAVANDFQRFSWNARFYLDLGRFVPLPGAVAKANLEMGWLRADALMPFENYYQGGIDGVRGYFPRSISPVVRVPGPTPSSPDRLVRVGGDKQVQANAELEVPLVPQLGIRGVVFFDAGNVYAPGESFFYLGQAPSTSDAVFDPRRDLPLGVYASAGAGIRWFSPIGPLRFEWGVPLTPRPRGTPGFPQGDMPFLFEFNIGGSF